ncbi:MAG: NAD(P)H-dependent oxidoreductase [Verrucomicrobiia bacterium]
MLTLIAGTNRPESNTRRVTKAVERIYTEENAEFEVLDLAQLPSEIFSPLSYAEKPKAFEHFSKTILNSKGLVIVTPEYNGSVPGILKYFIDMLKFPESFEQKPVCFIGLAAGMWGALRPVEQLELIFGYRNALIYPDRVFMPRINDLLDAKGKFKDEEMPNRLRTQARGFIEFVRKLKG